MPELIGIHNGTDGVDLPVRDFQGERADHAMLAVVGDRARLAVDQGGLPVRTILLGATEQPEDEPGDPVRPVQRLTPGQALAAAVADHDHVGGEQAQ